METRHNVTFLGIRDKSLQAYKEWIIAFYTNLLGRPPEERSEAQWEESWKKFCQNANANLKN